MKTVTQDLLVLLMVVLIPGCTTPEQKDSSQAKPVPATATPASPSVISKQAINFLSFAFELRKMNITRAELAQQRSKNQAIREYGALLIEDQSKLRDEIAALIQAKKIVLPKFIDLHYNDELASLQKKKENEFDQAFISSMIRDHQEEIKAFREALAFDDPDVKFFALKYLPIIEKSLTRLEVLSREY